MRRINYLFICILLISAMGLTTASATTLEVPTYSLSEEEKTQFLDNLDLESIDSSPKNASIYCFDVSEKGTIALAVSGHRIFVYDSSGTLQYGCQFQSDGAFTVEFQGETLAIYFVRGCTFVLLDANGKCTDVQREAQPNQYPINERFNQTSKVVGEKTYLLERDTPIGDSYGRFVIESNGNRVVFYDASIEHTISQILLVAFIISFIGFCIYGIIQKRLAVEAAQ